MALRRVVAAIDVVINGQRQVDNLARAYQKVSQASQVAIRSVSSYSNIVSSAVRVSDNFSKAIGLNVSQQTKMAVATAQTARRVASLAEVARGATSGFMGMVNAIEKGRAKIDANGKTTRGLTDNILSLTKSMVLFSVMLPLVQLPQRMVESFGEFVKVGAQWQDQLRVTNTLLNLGENELKAYSGQVQAMAINYGLVTEDVKALMTTAASSVSAIKDNAEQLGAMGKAAYDAHTALELATASARLAYSTGTQATEATTTLIQVMATYGLELEHLTTVSDSLFAITDIGTIKFGELEHVLPRVTAAMGPLIQRYEKADDKINVMNESFAAFAAMTQVMSPEQAATSFANVFKDIGQMTGQQKQLVNAWEQARKTNANTSGDEFSLMPEQLMSKGPIGSLVQLRKIFDLRGEMMNAYVANQRRLGNTAEEDAIRMAGQSTLMQQYFDDVRAVRGFQLTSVEQLKTAQTEYEASRVGSVGRGAAQMDKSFLAQQKKFSSAWTAFQTRMFESIEPQLIGGLNPITEMFANLVEDADFKAAGFLPKLRILGNTLMTAFTNYFRSGGRDQIRSVGREIGTFIGESLTAFFRGGKDNVLVEAGMAFSEAFAEGVAQTLPSMLSAAVGSSIVRGLAEMAALRYMSAGRMGNKASYAASAGGAFAIEAAREADNPALSLLGGGLGTLAVAASGMAAAKGAWKAKQPVSTAGQNSIGGWMGAANKHILNRAANPAYNKGSFPTGRGWPGFGSIAKSGAGTVGGGLLGLALSIPAIMQAENEREQWSTIGSSVGMVGGGVLGGIAGAPIGGVGGVLLGAAGGLAGGAVGGALGGGLYDMLHPGTGQGVAEAEAPERMALAETFATGVDSSHAIPLLTQIRDVLIRQGGGSIPKISGAAGTAGGVPGGTGASGNLGSAFVDQINNGGQLSNEQAQAACGPAAAAFFARAYGRNPTLKEAYSLVTRIQGGDPAAAGVGGTRGVATLGTALNQMGVQNEVYSGENIDWGRLAENAKAGIPGVVNIGPNGKGFPGHYFQIGGYNPETGKFNVGPSGGILGAGGNKTEMTAEEMMALGPKKGAIYGIGPTGTGSGNGTVTEADVAGMPGGGGTGMGPGGVGGAVTISIQNMMNVEHMDGSTDIRALMGQMADILKQLSSGGSVVGQTGVVTP